MDHANTLRDLMDVLGHQRATLVGQSLGGAELIPSSHDLFTR
jgi:pimeloyl-ACP methyl ester carboxylesterase